MENHENGCQPRLYRNGTEQHLNEEQSHGGIRCSPGSRLQTSSSFPSHQRQPNDEHGDHRRDQPVTPLDDGGYVTEGRKEVAVAERPVVAASHPRSGDPHDRAEDDEEVRAGGGAPGEGHNAYGQGTYDM